MATKYWNERANHVKAKGAKQDLYTRPTKSAVISDLEQKLATAQAKLEQKIAEKDEKAIAKLQEIISSLQGTLARQRQ